MPNKKQKAKESKKTPLTLTQEILGILGGIASSVMAIYGFIKTFKDDVDGFSWLIVLGSVIWLILLWQMFQKRRVYVYVLFAFTIVAGVAGWVGWQGQNQAKENKVIVLVAEFDGSAEEKYHLRDELLRQLKATTKEYSDTEIIALDDVITEGQGSEYARQIGKDNHADIVIWAWYTETTTSNLNIYIENLSPNLFVDLKKTELLQPQATLADFESLTIQQKVGSEMSSIISFLNGYLRYLNGDYETAIERFTFALEKSSNDSLIQKSNIFLLLGNCYFSSSEINKSIDYFSQAIDEDEKMFLAYANRGMAYLTLEQQDNALKDFNKAILINPDFSIAYGNRGILYTKAGEYDKALADIDQAIELYPDLAEWYSDRGMIYSLLGESQKALDDFNTAVQKNPNSALVYTNRGGLYQTLRQYQQAIDDYNKAIEIQPDFILAYSNRGVAYKNIGEYDKAIEDQSKAIELNPNDSLSYTDRGYTYTDMGEFVKAIEDFNQAIHLNPNLDNAFNGRGYSYLLGLKQFENAISDFTQCIQINPNRDQAYLGRGLAYYALGKYEDSIKDFNSFIQLTPQYPDVYRIRGNAYQKIGKTTEAEADFAKYKELTGKDAPSEP